MKESKNLLDKNKLLFFKSSNFHSLFLFGLIILVCIFLDFYYSNSNLLIPFIITTLISSLITVISIPQLKKIKVKQIIRKEGPKNHFIKEGTPTMGGVFIIPIAIIIGNILYFNQDSYMTIVNLSMLIIFFMLIGLIDDLLSLKKQLNTGLKSNQKIILQIFASMIFIFICAANNHLTNNIEIGNREIDIGNLIYPLALFVLLAESNSSNLTDGLDGLLSGCSILIFTGLACNIVIESQNNNQSLAQLCIVMAGACMGFLFLNKNPAKIFMGDSGSLAIGASLGGIALISNNLWSLLIMGGILAAESISVIIQVIIFKISKKLTGKGYKIFLMTPLHHHFELQGKNENFIVGFCWLITLLLVIINLIIW